MDIGDWGACVDTSVPEDHATDAAPDSVADSGIYAGPESESSPSDSCLSV